MSPEERKCLEGVVYALMYVFIFLLSLPVLVKFMDSSWSKWLYVVLGLGGVAVILRARALLDRIR